MKKPCQKNCLVFAKGYGGLGGLLFAWSVQLCQTMMRCRWCAEIIFSEFLYFSSNCHSVESGLVTSLVTPTCLDEMGLLHFEFASALSGQNRDMTVEQAMTLLDEVTEIDRVITFHILSLAGIEHVGAEKSHNLGSASLKPRVNDVNVSLKC